MLVMQSPRHARHATPRRRRHPQHREAGAKNVGLPGGHRDRLQKRASTIYRGRPEFSIFGVGDYEFCTVEGGYQRLYKSLRFFAVGPVSGKPVVLDDTSYFLPCRSERKLSFSRPS